MPLVDLTQFLSEVGVSNLPPDRIDHQRRIDVGACMGDQTYLFRCNMTFELCLPNQIAPPGPWYGDHTSSQAHQKSEGSFDDV